MAMIVITNCSVAEHLCAVASIATQAGKLACARDLYVAAARLYEIAVEHDLSTNGRANLARLAEAAKTLAEGVVH